MPLSRWDAESEKHMFIAIFIIARLPTNFSVRRARCRLLPGIAWHVVANALENVAYSMYVTILVAA